MTILSLVPSLMVNATWFGASPTKTAAQNDTAFASAITSLPASGGAVYVPHIENGDYFISSSIVVDASNVSLLSNGARIRIDASADPAYALIVGNVNYVANCTIAGLTFVGRNSGSTTGRGIKWGCDTGTIRDCTVQQFGGTGIYANGVVGQIYNTLMENIYLFTNGLNVAGSDQARSNLYIDTWMADCEYIRVSCNGSPTNQAGAVTKFGIYVNGAPAQKFLLCHPYFHTADGLIIGNSATMTEVIGGEYESNFAGLEAFTGTDGTSIGQIVAYGNTNVDVGLAGDNASLSSSRLASTGIKNLVISGSQLDIASNTIISTNKAIEIDAGNSIKIHDNYLNRHFGIALDILSTHCDIHDNIIDGNIYEESGSGNNTFHDNDFLWGSFTLQQATSVFRNNKGYNPVGQVTAPAFPASTVAATNTIGVDVEAYIANGTAAITVVQIAGVAGTYATTGYQIAANGWGHVRIPAGGSVKFTYGSGSPSWTWFGD